MNKEVGAVIFDFDGTLVDSLDAFVEAMTTTVERLGLPQIPRKKLIQLVKLPSDKSLPIILPQGLNNKMLADRFVKEYRKAFKQTHLKHVRLVNGIIPTLNELKKMGFSIAVMTGRKLTVAYVPEELELLGLNRFVDTLATYGTVPSAKTKADLALECLRRLRLKGSECAVVGDSPEDIQTGKKLKALTIGVLYGFHSEEEIMNCQPDVTVQKSIEILNVLSKHKP